jgi:hypothetical protein
MNPVSEPRLIYRTDGEWMALLYEGNLFDTLGEWVGWLDGTDVYGLDGEYIGYINPDGRLLRQRVLPYRKRRCPPKLTPRFKPPKTVPLPPMFAELPYDVIDVFEETPHILQAVSELRPDAGESPLFRLSERDPRVATQQKLRQIERNLMEEMVYGIIYSYGVTRPPVPIEAMAAGLPLERATEIEPISPAERLRLAEEMIDKLGRSPWAVERGYGDGKGFTPAQTEYAARALLLPRHWLLKIPEHLRWPPALILRFLVPEWVVSWRLHDLE